MGKTSMVDGSANTDSVLKKTKRMFGFKKSSKENSIEDSPALGKKFGFKKGSSEEKSKEESPGTSKKKVGFSKLASKDTSDEGSPASAKKKFGFPKLVTKESNESGSPATQKKFFRFGSLGTKKKKGASDENLDKPGGSNSFTVSFCTIERDLDKVMDHFSDLNCIDELKKNSLHNITDCKTKDTLENGFTNELCKSLSDILSNQIFKEKTESKQKIDSSLLSTSRIKHECEIPEVFLYSPPEEDLKYEREVISPGEEDFDFWHQWQSEELATVRLSSEWVDDLEVIEEESELGDLDVIYEESEEEYNSEDKASKPSDSEKYQLKEEINTFSDNFMPENFNIIQDNQENKPLEDTTINTQLLSNDLQRSFINHHNQQEITLLKSNEILETNQYKDNEINRENSEDEIDKGLERISEEIYELTEEKENYDWWGHLNSSEESGANFGDLASHSVEKLTDSTNKSQKASDILGNGESCIISDEIEEFEPRIESDNNVIEPSENFGLFYKSEEDNKEEKVNNLWKVIASSENSNVCNDDINVIDSEETAYEDEYAFHETVITKPEENDAGEPFYVQDKYERSSLIICEEQLDNIEENVEENSEENSVICIERIDSEGENSSAVKNRTVEEEEDILQCLDNEIGTLVNKIKSVHNINIHTNELVLSQSNVNMPLVDELEVKNTLGNCSGEVGTESVECVDKFSVTSPRTSRSNSISSSSSSSIASNSNNSSQHIPHSGDTILSATDFGSAMADVDESISETRMEVDEGVEDAEEVEVAEDAADKEEEDEEGDDVIAKYVDKQEKMDEEALTFNKDDDDDDELPDFESQKPKKKSSKSSKENGVDDEKKKKKRRKAPDGKKKRVSRSTGEEKENKKATYQKDDILAKHVGPRVRSFDSKTIQKRFDKPKSDDIHDIIESRTKKIHVRSFDSKRIQKNFNRTRPASTQLSNDCKMCGKQVYQMEKIVAEKASWHKNCFRCKECNKNLTLETYQSHEGALYCKPHFKELFQPKAVIEDENEARKERSTDKPDYGLEELSSANVNQKFSMFE